MSECLICGETGKRLVKHHTDYEKDITVLLCDKCHRNLHAGNIDAKELLPDMNFKKDMSLLQYPVEITITCYEARSKTVPYTGGTSANINLPKKYCGHKVMILLVDD